jgi:23S rRNA pseudouridine2605 synthase
MRLNKYISANTSLSRRHAEEAIKDGRVTINGKAASITSEFSNDDKIYLDGQPVIPLLPEVISIVLNKPIGYVCSKDGQGSKTVYDLLPHEYIDLNIAGRLDKDSSGLVLLTNNGKLLNELTHPRFNKRKVYQVILNKPLISNDEQHIKNGLMLDDGVSKLHLNLWRRDGRGWTVTMNEGRNRQIRRTFAALNYKVVSLHRTKLGNYTLNDIKEGKFKSV